MGVHVSDDPAGLGWVITRAEALASGVSPAQIRLRVESGRWTSWRPGTYVRSWALPPIDDRFERERRDHVLKAVSVALLASSATISFTSAALVHDLPLVSGVPSETHLAVPSESWAGHRRGVHSHRLELPAMDREVSDKWNVAVTTASRTWGDIARTASLADALSVGDRALREGAVTREQLESVLERTEHLRGRVRAVEAFTLLDGRRETALESLSFARFIEWGIPVPVMQHELWDDEGFVGRVDFWWPEFGLVGEADGRVKYAGSPDAMWHEKRRELRLQRLGLRVVRWVWIDVAYPSSPFRAALARCFTRAA
ncbi:MAG: hypothetical protein NTZ03_14800 [Actinobacteria bacterium]|nr:hypothetical protein [Actinomycetota bacterium]